MGWETQEARREPCNDPARSPVGTLQWVKKSWQPIKDLAIHWDGADPVPVWVIATDPKMNWPRFLAPVPSSSFPIHGA